MPTTRHRRARHRVETDDLTDGKRQYLLTGDVSDDDTTWWWWMFDQNAPGTLWVAVRDALLEDWIAASPGSRPWAWWRYDAPRVSSLPGTRWLTIPEWVRRETPEPRRRLGGRGTPCHEVLNDVPQFRFGLPVRWVGSFDVGFYNGRLRDMHGNRIGTQYAEGHFTGVAVDPGNPPRYEAQASYLERQGLLHDGERQRLTEADFVPVTCPG